MASCHQGTGDNKCQNVSEKKRNYTEILPLYSSNISAQTNLQFKGTVNEKIGFFSEPKPVTQKGPVMSQAQVEARWIKLLPLYSCFTINSRKTHQNVATVSPRF